MLNPGGPTNSKGFYRKPIPCPIVKHEHDDKRPAAHLHERGGVYCHKCGRFYTTPEVEQALGIITVPQSRQSLDWSTPEEQRRLDNIASFDALLQFKFARFARIVSPRIEPWHRWQHLCTRVADRMYLAWRQRNDFSTWADYYHRTLEWHENEVERLSRLFESGLGVDYRLSNSTCRQLFLTMGKKAIIIMLAYLVSDGGRCLFRVSQIPLNCTRQNCRKVLAECVYTQMEGKQWYFEPHWQEMLQENFIVEFDDLLDKAWKKRTKSERDALALEGDTLDEEVWEIRRQSWYKHLLHLATADKNDNFFRLYVYNVLRAKKVYIQDICSNWVRFALKESIGDDVAPMSKVCAHVLTGLSQYMQDKYKPADLTITPLSYEMQAAHRADAIRLSRELHGDGGFAIFREKVEDDRFYRVSHARRYTFQAALPALQEAPPLQDDIPGLDEEAMQVWLV